MTPEEADEFVSNHSGIEVIERDLDPDDEKMGRAQFLVTLIDSDAEIERELEDTELEIFKESKPNQFRHIALPPN